MEVGGGMGGSGNSGSAHCLTFVVAGGGDGE